MTIEGDYTLFAHLETVYLGVLARRTLIATNVDAACSRRRTASRSSSCRRGTTTIACRPVTATPRTSPGPSSARRIGVTTDAQASWWGGRGVGTVPHCADRGLRRQHRARGDEVRRVGADGHERHRAGRLRERLRADGARGRAGARPAPVGRAARHVAASFVDRSLWDEMGDFKPRGVNERLVRKVRDALDARRLRAREDRRLRRLHGRARSSEFERSGVPVDAYGVGSSLIRGSNDFTADVVLTDGRPSAKVGRAGYRPSPRLEPASADESSAIRSPTRATPRGSVERTTCMPAAAKRSNAASGLVRVVDDSRHDHRRGAVLERGRPWARPRLARSSRRPPGGRRSSTRRSGSSPGRRRSPRRTRAAARPGRAFFPARFLAVRPFGHLRARASSSAR